MTINQKGNTICVKYNQIDFISFLEKFSLDFTSFKNQNIIIDLKDFNFLTVKDLTGFVPFSKKHKKAKKSFVLVTNELDFNAISPKLDVVRSKQEAYDIVEMDEIQRDLGL